MSPESAAVGVAWVDVVAPGERERSATGSRESFGGQWVAAVFAAGEFQEALLADEVGAIWSRYGETAASIVVGVPVGLVETGDPERECDARARAAVGPRADAIVTPPAREPARRRRYPAARRAHERTTGGRLSEAAFSLAPAITAVDELLQEVPESRATVVAGHPEVAYRAFAGEHLAYEPTTAGGYAERMRALAAHDRDAPPSVQEAAEAVSGAGVGVHHVLDALALGYTARDGPGEFRTLPAEPPTDETGLAMAWSYRSEEPLEGA